MNEQELKNLLDKQHTFFASGATQPVAFRLAKCTRVSTPVSQFAAKSFRSPSPYGTVLIMSP